VFKPLAIIASASPRAAEDRRDADERPHADRRVALGDDAAADRVGALVVRAGGNLHAARQAEIVRHRVGHRPDHRAGRRGRRQLLPIQPGKAQQFCRPIAAFQVEKQRPVCQGVIHHRLRPQHKRDEAAPQQEFVGTGVEVGLMLLNPEQLREAVVVAERIAIDAIQARVVQDALQNRQIRLAARVKVEDGGARICRSAVTGTTASPNEETDSARIGSGPACCATSRSVCRTFSHTSTASSSAHPG
jgi:hypothetical protein